MSIGLNNGIRALLASQSVLDTIGHNLANANTRGYSRQRVDLVSERSSSVRGVLIGSGVKVGGLSRAADELLNGRILSQLSIANGFSAQLGNMLEIESFFAEGSESSIGSLMNDMFGSLADLSASPNDSTLRVGAVNAASSFAGTVRNVAETLATSVSSIRGQVAIEVRAINGIAAEIADLNVQISEAQGAGFQPNDLLDQRDVALQELAARTDITIQDAGLGAVRVSTGGQVIVGSSESVPLDIVTVPGGQLAAKARGASDALDLRGGSLGGLLAFQDGFTGDLSGDLDSFIKNLILEANRSHSTGVPVSGGFTELTSTNRLVDTDANGDFTDERLSLAGLPFDIQSGELFVNVVDENSGALVKHRIEIDDSTTVREFLGQIEEIPELSASVDGVGQIRIESVGGSRFDFSARLDPNPDDAGAFGSGKASIGSDGNGPFGLVPGDTLDLTVNGVPISVPFAGADFEDIGNATAEEIAAVLNADPNFRAAGVTASDDNGQLSIQTLGEGGTQSITVDGGAVATAVGWGPLVGTPVLGQDQSVEPTISGVYTGEENETYSFVPNMDGAIGETPGLTVGVYDKAGALVTTLEVGEDYIPGSDLEVVNGVSVAFNLGQISATNNEGFSVDVQADSDTTDVLVALGINGFFTGTSASDFDVSEHLSENPDLLASSASGYEGNNGKLLELIDLQTAAIDGLDGESLGGSYSGFVGRLGLEVSTVRQGLESSATVLEGLESRRAQLTGVNVDEELVDLVRFEQAYSAAARYLSVLQELDQQILSII